MKKHFLLIVLLLILPFISLAQHQIVLPSPEASSGITEYNAGTFSGIFNQPCDGLLIPEQNQPKWNISVRNTFLKKHDMNDVLQIKENLNAIKFGTTLKEQEEVSDEKTVVPYVNLNFEANWSLVGTPPDNSMAISNGGYVVTVNNDDIEYYNTSGTFLYYSYWSDFFNDATLTSIIYDPRVIYDSQADRFILVILHGSSSTTSKVILGVSKTNNPSDGWWVYKLTGNPLNNSCWVDFPNIGVSTHDIFITGNLFSNSGSFNQAVIYQISKSSCLSGGTINWAYFSGLSSSPYNAFSLVPLSNGQQGNYGPGIYLVSNNNSSASAIRLWHVTNNLGSSPTLNSSTVTTTAYSVAGDAQQSGSSDYLSIGDCRIMSGFYLDGTAHFVFHSNIGSGWNGINYNRLNISTLTNQSVGWGLAGTYDYCYPSVASFATSPTDKSVMIAFLRSSSAIFPEVRVVNCDDAMAFSSSVQVKAGETFVNYMTGNERWGDYSGACRKHNNASPTVWLAGCYGANISGYANNVYKTRVAEITGGPVTEIEENENNQTGCVFPNPIADLMHVSFDAPGQKEINISIYDQEGRLVKLLYRDTPRQGAMKLTFNRGALSKGIYFVNIMAGNELLKSEKVVMVN